MTVITTTRRVNNTHVYNQQNEPLSYSFDVNADSNYFL